MRSTNCSHKILRCLNNVFLMRRKSISVCLPLRCVNHKYRFLCDMKCLLIIKGGVMRVSGYVLTTQLSSANRTLKNLMTAKKESARNENHLRMVHGSAPRARDEKRFKSCHKEYFTPFDKISESLWSGKFTILLEYHFMLFL